VLSVTLSRDKVAAWATAEFRKAGQAGVSDYNTDPLAADDGQASRLARPSLPHFARSSSSVSRDLTAALLPQPGGSEGSAVF
jgi:hypothetical protein